MGYEFLREKSEEEKQRVLTRSKASRSNLFQLLKSLHPALSCLIFLGGFWLSLSLMGCASSLRFGPQGQLDDPAQVLAALSARTRSVEALQADAKVKVQTPEQKGTVDVFLTARLPDELRLGVLDFFGRPMADVLALSDHLQIHDVSHRVVYVGKPSQENMAKVLFVPVAPKEWVHFFLGDVPKVQDAEMTMSLDQAENAYRITLVSKASREVQTLYVDTEYLRLLKATSRTPNGGYNLELDDFQRVDGVDLPFQSTISLVDGAGNSLGIGLSAMLREVRLKGHLPKKTFEAQLPRGAKVLDLDGGAPAFLNIPLKTTPSAPPSEGL